MAPPTISSESSIILIYFLCSPLQERKKERTKVFDFDKGGESFVLNFQSLDGHSFSS